MSSSQTIILITGGNAGIGFEIVSQLLRASANNHVIIGTRSLQRGELALAELRSEHPSLSGLAEIVELDITKPETIEKAAKHVDVTHGRLDVIVNNAGVAFFAPGTAVADMFRRAFETNVVGVQATTEALIPLLKKANGSRLLNVSSSVGSITRRLDPSDPYYASEGDHYRVSKAALNMLSACHHYKLHAHGVKVFTIDPGFTVSNLSPRNTPENGARPTADAAASIVRVINGEEDDKAGGFLTDMEGMNGLLPW